MAISDTLQSLAKLLSGAFDNQAQALAEPAWYVHLKLWHRWVELFEDSITLFIEQISVASGKPPYRQRLIRLQAIDGHLLGRYYGLKDPEQFQGAATQPQRLAGLSLEDLIDLPTCRVQIRPDPYGFTARMAPDQLGSFEYQGRTTYLSLGFDIGRPPEAGGKVQFAMYDKGIDPMTGKATWGALMGPFRLDKCP
ncbi:chorismate mutase [filamentous cyanobacterium CCP5]|nr:chorismate mutase [filamentous cyanobacterium CCP5]